MNKSQIKEIYKKFHVPKHIIRHMEQVANVAIIFVKAFQQEGIKLDEKSITSAALLHDTLRICDFRSFEPEKIPQKVTPLDIKIWQELREKYGEIGHAKAMANYLKRISEPTIANLVKKHDFKEVDNLKTLEEKIVFYADKRVDNDVIVSTKERIQEGEKRNGQGKKDARRDEIIQKIFTLEKELKKLLGGRLPI